MPHKEMEDSGYILNPEQLEEMCRLLKQGQLATSGMGGVLSEQRDVESIHDVLDLACGPGEWALHVAQRYPHIYITGIDISPPMIQFANTRAQAERLPARFAVMDATALLAFPDASFDLINSRFIIGFLRQSGWISLLTECYRLLRPGGIMRVTEAEVTLSTSTSVQTWVNWIAEALSRLGKGSRSGGSTIDLKPKLADVGFERINHCTHAIDFSYGQPACETLLENLVQVLALQNFLTPLGIATKEQVVELAKQIHGLERDSEFCGYWVLFTVWGYKPE